MKRFMLDKKGQVPGGAPPPIPLAGAPAGGPGNLRNPGRRAGKWKRRFGAGRIAARKLDRKLQKPKSPWLKRSLFFAAFLFVFGIELFWSDGWWVSLGLLALIGIYNIFSTSLLTRILYGFTPLVLAVLSFETFFEDLFLINWFTFGAPFRYVIIGLLGIGCFFLIRSRDPIARRIGKLRIALFILVFVFAVLEAGVFGADYQIFSAWVLNALLLVLGLRYLFKGGGTWTMKTFGIVSIILALAGGYTIMADYLSLGFTIPFLGAGEALRYGLILVLLIYTLFSRHISNAYGQYQQHGGP